MLIRTEEFMLKKERRVALLYPYKPHITEMLKTIDDLSWSHEHDLWHIPYSENYLKKLNSRFAGNLRFVDLSTSVESIESSNKALISNFKRFMKDREYCDVTIVDYASHIRQFFKFCNNCPANEITPEMCREYIIHIVEVKKLSVTYQSHTISSMKLFFRKFLLRRIEDHYLPRPKNPNQIPIVLNEKEVASILKEICDMRDKCMIYLVYSAGLKVGEVVYIKPEHVDTVRMKIYITSAKGDRDRYVILSKKVLALLMEYYEIYQPQNWLFENAKGGRYNKKLIQNSLQKAVRKSGINKRVTLTILKNSFAVHLIERGIDIRYVQKMLGLKNSVSAVRFLKASKRELKQIESPLDNMDV